MATKKKAAKDNCPQEIVITAVGANAQFTYLDPKGNKHHAKVYWQALDPTTQYQISLPDPPAPLPFTRATGNGPFLTDPVTGRTITLAVDNNVNSGNTVYNYNIDVVPPAAHKGRRRKMQLAGGGIIIDA